MKFDELQKNMFVEDRWFWDWGIGKVTKIMKTVVRIKFSVVGVVTFDKAHVQFLERIS
jgi:hypothetical protein